MDTKDRSIASFTDFHNIMINYKLDKTTYFRGQSRIEWPLVPKAGRKEYSWTSDALYFHSWKRRAIEYVINPPTSDWDWLAIAQHHGLATRFLDWSTNPMVAAYFAAYENQDSDGVIYAANFKYRVAQMDESPMKFKDIAIYRPKGLSTRIVRQGGLFSVHPKPSQELKESEHLPKLDKIVIPKSYKKNLISELAYYGINRATIFPDLDGLSNFINWTLEEREYLKAIRDENEVSSDKNI